MLGRGFLLTLALVASLLMPVGPTLVAQEAERFKEYQLKATYLFYFSQYVDWPMDAVPGDNKKFVVGVLGPNPFDRSLLDDLARRKVQDKKIVVRKFASAKDYQPCHILFVSGLEDEKGEEKTVGDRVPPALTKTKGSPVLLVGDTEGLAQKGMIISFFVDAEGKVKLEINPGSAKRAGLKISARLLQVGKIVE